MREYGLTPDDVHDSFNLWMATTIDDDGHRQFKWNPAQRGDRIELLAMFDILAVAVICGLGDLVGINNFTFTPVKLEVLEATPTSTALVDEIEQRWGKAGQPGRHRATSRRRPCSPNAQLERDPAYQPNFRAAPRTEQIAVELSDEDHDLLAGPDRHRRLRRAPTARRSEPRSCDGATATSRAYAGRSSSSPEEAA